MSEKSIEELFDQARQLLARTDELIHELLQLNEKMSRESGRPRRQASQRIPPPPDAKGAPGSEFSGGANA